MFKIYKKETIPLNSDNFFLPILIVPRYTHIFTQLNKNIILYHNNKI